MIRPNRLKAELWRGVRAQALLRDCTWTPNRHASGFRQTPLGFVETQEQVAAAGQSGGTMPEVHGSTLGFERVLGAEGLGFAQNIKPSEVRGDKRSIGVGLQCRARIKALTTPVGRLE